MQDNYSILKTQLSTIISELELIKKHLLTVKITVDEFNINLITELSPSQRTLANDVKNILLVSCQQVSFDQKLNIIFTNKMSVNSSTPKPLTRITGIKKIILVSSCKGGVGKSTLSAAIAQQLESAGNKVGLFDADIYGPSIPVIFNIIEEKLLIKNRQFIPHIKHNIAIISLGLIVQANLAATWRGPMASKTITHLFSAVKWPELDYLIIDMPPGTGDIYLTFLENYSIDEAIIITTPQKISYYDVVKSIDLYKKFNINIRGIIENMASKDNLLQSSGRLLAEQYQLPLMASILYNPQIANLCDKGERIDHLFPNLI